MKILPSLILSLTLFGLWSCSDAGKDPLSFGDETVCTQELDCNGDCGGSVVIDVCGVCDGNDSTCTGCTDENANNYDNTAIISCSDDNGDSTPDCCAYGDDIAGCTNSGACNFNAQATLNDGTCWTPTDGCACTDVQGAVVDDCGICGGDNSSCSSFIDYLTEIQPIFTSRCVNCHINGNSGGLNLSSWSNLMAGNSNNGPVVSPGDSTNSPLWIKVNSGMMPQSGSKLTDTQIHLIGQWIYEGALAEPPAN